MINTLYLSQLCSTDFLLVVNLITLIYLTLKRDAETKSTQVKSLPTYSSSLPDSNGIQDNIFLEYYKNAITDGGSTATHSKVISGWMDGLDPTSPPRAPCGASKYHPKFYTNSNSNLKKKKNQMREDDKTCF